jgi:hypothetical protein
MKRLSSEGLEYTYLLEKSNEPLTRSHVYMVKVQHEHPQIRKSENKKGKIIFI